MTRNQVLIRTRWVCMAGLLFTSPFTASGQPASLLQWMQTALENNPMVTAAKARVEAGEKEVRIAPSLPDPALSGGYFISPVETRVGPQLARVGVSQMVPWPGKLLARKGVAKKELAVAREALKSVEARILSDVRVVYATYYALGKEIGITRDNLKLLQEMENVLLSRYSAAATSQASLIKVQIEMATLEDKISSLEAEEVTVREKAIVLLNLPAGTKLRSPDVLPEIFMPGSVETIVDSALKMNPSIWQARYEVETASARIGLARQSFTPDLMFMSDYMFTGTSSSAMTNPSENGKNSWIVGGSITVPVWAGSKMARTGKAEAMKTMAEANLTDIENQTRSNAASLLEEHNDAKRKVALYAQTLIPQTQQMVLLAREEYINGKATLLDFLDARRMLLKLEVMLEKQRAQLQIIAGKMDLLLGGTLTRNALGKND